MAMPVPGEIVKLLLIVVSEAELVDWFAMRVDGGGGKSSADARIAVGMTATVGGADAEEVALGVEVTPGRVPCNAASVGCSVWNDDCGLLVVASVGGGGLDDI
jgi:hypothetical protein